MNYTCPYCGHLTTIIHTNKDRSWQAIDIAAEHLEYNHRLGLAFDVVACPNIECKKIVLAIQLTKARKQQHVSFYDESVALQTWRLLPESHAKPQPTYIPVPIVQDYTEACRILSLSPKASAALARRCMQGMIRDFHDIRKGTLNAEIMALQGKVPQVEWEAMDALRSIGNIGAHMEKDVNLIIEVDPDEADKLIAFIEYLFKQWYVRRYDDQQNLAEIKRIAGLKKEIKSQSPAAIMPSERNGDQDS